jgi:hypothetical protein
MKVDFEFDDTIAGEVAAKCDAEKMRGDTQVLAG